MDPMPSREPHVPAVHSSGGHPGGVAGTPSRDGDFDDSAADMRVDYLGTGNRSEVPIRSVLLTVMPIGTRASKALRFKAPWILN
jgi:hypothetical protein